MMQYYRLYGPSAARAARVPRLVPGVCLAKTTSAPRLHRLGSPLAAGAPLHLSVMRVTQHSVGGVVSKSAVSVCD
jgi:hypothetical protein